MKKHLLIIIVVLISTSSNYIAQSIAIGPQGSYSKSSDADKAVIMPSAAIRINLVGLGIEGSVGYKTEEFENGSIKTTSYPVMLTGMLNLLPIIHAEAGVGWYMTKVDYSSLINSLGVNDKTLKKIGYHIGAGLELPLGNLLLTGDIRYVFLDLKLDSVASVKNAKSDFYSIVVGLLFKL